MLILFFEYNRQVVPEGAPGVVWGALDVLMSLSVPRMVVASSRLLFSAQWWGGRGKGGVVRGTSHVFLFHCVSVSWIVGSQR